MLAANQIANANMAMIIAKNDANKNDGGDFPIRMFAPQRRHYRLNMV